MIPKSSNYASKVIIGKNAIEESFGKMEGCKSVILTTKNPYRLLEKNIQCLDAPVLFVESNNIRDIERLRDFKEIRNADTLCGVGAGTVIDVSKIISSELEKKLTVVPTALSCNVFATNKSVILDEGKAKTINSKIPDSVIIDPSIIMASDSRYYLAGIADILSIYTAMHDWKIAFKNKKENCNSLIGKMAQTLVNSTIKGYKELLRRDEQSIEKLAKLLLTSGYITNYYGSGRPESGSEHMFARAIEESKHNKKLLHGEAVLLGILMSSELQGQENSFVYDIANRMNMLSLLDKAAVTEDDLANYLVKASTIRRERFTIFNTINLSEDYARCVVKKIISGLENEKYKKIWLPQFRILDKRILFLGQHPVLEFDREINQEDKLTEKILIDEGILIKKRWKLDEKNKKNKGKNNECKCNSAGKKNILILEPHPDDFALSCSGYALEQIKNGSDIKIVNMFSKYSLSTFPWRKSVSISESVYERIRLKESYIALTDYIGVKFESFRFPSALKRDHKTPFETMNDKDAILESRIQELVMKEILSNKYTTIISPAGIQHHADHILAYNVALKIKKEQENIELLLYEDYPYARNRPAYNERMNDIHGNLLISQLYTATDDLIEVMADLISIYRSQFDDLNRSQILAIVKEDGRNIAVEGKMQHYSMKGEFAQRVLKVGGFK